MPAAPVNLPESRPQAPNTVRFVCISDTHDVHALVRPRMSGVLHQSRQLQPAGTLCPDSFAVRVSMLPCVTQMPELPAGDVLIHAGDFSRVGQPDAVRAFNDWLGQQTQFKHRIVIAVRSHSPQCRYAVCLGRGQPASDASACSSRVMLTMSRVITI